MQINQTQRIRFEKAFLAYANISLRDNPRNFLKIFNIVNDYHPFIVHTKNLLVVIDCIVALSMSSDPDQVECVDEITTVAAEAVYGYKNGFCESQCPKRRARELKWGKTCFQGNNRLKCYECEQRDFIRMLSEITEGKNYSQIKGLIEFMNNSCQFDQKLNGENLILPIDVGKKEELRKFVQLKTADPVSFASNGEEQSKFIFFEFWNGLIAYILSQVLLQDAFDREKFKRCPICDTFFISGHKNRRCCTDKCQYQFNKEYHQKDMASRRDPDSPKFDPKYIR
jgi:hypothetical protein